MVNDGFCVEKEENIFQNYMNEYVVIYPQGIQHSCAGKVVGIIDGYAVLNPFQGTDYDTEGRPVKKMITPKFGALVPILGALVEPYSKENLEGFCCYINRLEGIKSEKTGSKE